ncbi:MAG TPA: tRNA lysidine(34) synthetase TilS [Bacteroidales bacterium]|nr:tRNA lysidine(34) synthetase TilS [Bacteroidales bacterium]
MKNLSIQEAARVLRYRWFENIRKENNYDLIAVGHNKNDIAETFLFNLLRGTGTDGLTGIKPLSGKIVRPLLFASREEIKYFAREAQLLFREDSSNRSEKYARNFIRHRILPSLQKVNIQAIDHIVAAAKKIDDTNQIALETIRNFANKIVIHHHDKISVSVKLLLKQKQPIPFLYFILKDFGFNPKELPKILEALNYPGRQFHSSSHSLFTGRDFFYIYPKQNLVTKKSFRIETLKPEITEPINLAFSIIENTDNFVIKKNNRFASFDYDKIIFPLIIRKWKNGDSFYPLGMKKKKKLSDFFIDEKIPIPEKEAMWLLETDGAICWLIGKRIDDRFKVTPTTKRILQIEMTE